MLRASLIHERNISGYITRLYATHAILVKMVKKGKILKLRLENKLSRVFEMSQTPEIVKIKYTTVK
jgi:hypothetical protein